MRSAMTMLVILGLAAWAPGCESSSDSDTKGGGVGLADTAGGGDTGQLDDGRSSGADTSSDDGAVGADAAGGADVAATEDTATSEDTATLPDTAASEDTAATQDTAGAEDTAEDTASVEDTSKPTFEMDDEGCLTYGGASALCGAASDKSVCALAATCRPDGDTGQCSIDCEMSPSVGCLDQAAIDCVLDATAAGVCEDLANCAGWYLVY